MALVLFVMDGNFAGLCKQYLIFYWPILKFYCPERKSFYKLITRKPFNAESSVFIRQFVFVVSKDSQKVIETGSTLSKYK